MKYSSAEEADFKEGLGCPGKFDIMNYAVAVELGKQLPRWHKYVHMNGYLNDFVLVLTQTSVKYNGKAHKNF